MSIETEFRFVEDVLDLFRRSFALARRVRQGDPTVTSSEIKKVIQEFSPIGRRDFQPNINATSRGGFMRWSRFLDAGSGNFPSVEHALYALGPGHEFWGQFAIALTTLVHAYRVGGLPAFENACRTNNVPSNRWWRRCGSGDPGIRVFAVIHVLNSAHARSQSRLALDCGVDGVFLINHGISVDELLDVYGDVRTALGNEPFIGINALGGDPVAVVRKVHDGRIGSRMFDGLWVDNANIDESSLIQPDTNSSLVETLWVDDAPYDRWKAPVYFGGVAFKYQRSVADLCGAARAAAGHLDVLTTSGSGTGSAPTAAKISELVDAAPGLPVAIASGITPENLADVAGRAHAVLVATGISRDFHHLDPQRVRALVAAAARLNATSEIGR